jgi:hypothetical protein
VEQGHFRAAWRRSKRDGHSLLARRGEVDWDEQAVRFTDIRSHVLPT